MGQVSINGTPVENMVEERQMETPETMRAVILRKLDEVNELKQKRKLVVEQITSVLDNNQELQEAQGNASEHIEAVKFARLKARSTDEVIKLKTQAKEFSDEIKDIGYVLNEQLIAYTKATGVNVIEDNEGKELKIKHKVSVVSGQMRLF